MLKIYFLLFIYVQIKYIKKIKLIFIHIIINYKFYNNDIGPNQLGKRF